MKGILGEMIHDRAGRVALFWMLVIVVTCVSSILLTTGFH